MIDKHQDLAFSKRQSELIEKYNLKETKYQASEILNTYEYYSDIGSRLIWQEWIKSKKARHKRRLRFYDKLENVIGYYNTCIAKGEKVNLVFGTCTFDNKTLLNTKEETRTKKVNKWLKSHFMCCMANIDYGEVNEREHHHFVALTGEELEPSKTNRKYKVLSSKDYTLGFQPTLEVIVLNDKRKKLSNYMAKINNHSNKKSTRNRRLRVFGID